VTASRVTGDVELLPRNSAAFSRCPASVSTSHEPLTSSPSLCCSVAEWTLSGHRSADYATADDTQHNAAALSQQPHVPQVPVQVPVPGSQVMTIDDEQPSVAAAHAPRTASLLQRLLSACACGAREGTFTFCRLRTYTPVCSHATSVTLLASSCRCCSPSGPSNT
jgi:hypothetical protein